MMEKIADKEVAQRLGHASCGWKGTIIGGGKTLGIRAPDTKQEETVVNFKEDYQRVYR